ncbi:MAG: GGDEF domain-containing protein [Rhodospirillaceae bacterium]|nr:GGDEF domain-containing protein [Rhodospirillaceae bacterium]
MFFASLRIRLNLLIALILVGGFLATNIISYQVSKGTLRTSILDHELPLSSNNVYSEIQRDLLQPIFVSSQMATNSFLRDWVLEGEREPERMTRYLLGIRDKYNAFTSYFISAKTNRYYHFTGPSRVVSESDPADGWFFRARDLKEPYEVNVDTNVEQGSTITIFINYRVLDYGGNFIGIAGVGLGLDSVGKTIAAYQKSFRRSIYFIEDNGQIRLHSNDVSKGADNIHALEGIGSLADELLSKERGSYTYERGGETFLLTTRYLPELKWHLLIELSERQATAGLRRSFLYNIGIGTVVIIITMLLIGYTIGLFQARLEEMATTDKLTGLGNRQVFESGMRQAMARYRRTQEPFSLIMIDLDNFKRINDTHGHVVGDRVIKKFADLAGGLVRETDIICRWGGEEFVILAPACTRDDALLLAEKIRTAAGQAIFVAANPEYRLTLSAGITQAEDRDSEDTVLVRADKALYQAKEKGRNCCVVD